MKEIENTYSRVTDWLKYAEAKNAILVAFDSTVSLAIIGLMVEKKEIIFIPNWYLQISLFFFIGGAAIALVSFLPQLIQFKPRDCMHRSCMNPLYFYDIAKMDEEEYTKLICERYETEGRISQYDKDLINQIVNNSKIAVVKFRTFSIALWLNISVFLTPVILIIPLIVKLRGKYDRRKSSPE